MVNCLVDELSGNLGREGDGRDNGWRFYYMASSSHGRMDSALVVRWAGTGSPADWRADKLALS